MKLGLIGLGKMGTRISMKLLEEGNDLVVWNRSSDAVEEFKVQSASRRTKLKIATTIEDLVQSLEVPRIIWLMLPAGEATETVLREVATFVHPGDIIVDGGNAHFKDTERRSLELRAKGIKFLGIGVSGGVHALKNGYPLMVGGDGSAYEEIRTILDSLSKPNGGHAYFGKGGAGHFVKMVHNGIEYGMMQAIGEGFGVLQEAAYHFDLEKVARMYQKGTLISGFMMDRTVDALKKDPDLSKIDGVIGSASGETAWTIEEAKKADLPIGIIEASYDFRVQSEKDEKIQRSIAAKLVSALRFEFGGHDVKKK